VYPTLSVSCELLCINWNEANFAWAPPNYRTPQPSVPEVTHDRRARVYCSAPPLNFL